MATRDDDAGRIVRGRRLTFPVRIRDASAAASVHLVPTRLVRGALADAGTRLAPLSVLGRTPVVVLFVDYRDNDLGDYDEVGLAVPARHRGRRGAHVLQLPVTQVPALTTLAPRDGVVLASPVRMRARGLRLGSGGSVLPGTGHPMARQMRALGLPRRPVLSVVVDHVAFDMDPAEELPAP